MMTMQGQHRMLPDNTHDETHRQMFVSELKLHLAGQVSPQLRQAYENRIKPAIQREHKRPPKTRHEVRRAMATEPTYQLWSSLQRTSQEMKQDTQSEIAIRQLEHLVSRADTLRRNATVGSLSLNSDLEVPRYMRAIDVHCIPGGYHNELTNGDVMPAAVYDPGVFLYSMGRMGAFNEDMGETILAFLKERHPRLAVERILDMGCSVGHSTVPYVEAFPQAGVHGIDISAPFLRYAHARAESMGKAIQFTQQNAEKTNYDDESFDLVVSHILLHETSHKALINIFNECHRILRPGGVMIHAETPLFAGMDPYDQFILDWDTYNNNEPFWGPLKDLDLRKIAGECDFNSEQCFSHVQPSAIQNEYSKGRTKLFQGGDFGGAGAWFLFGASKS